MIYKGKLVHCNANINYKNMSENDGRASQKFSNKMACSNSMEKLTRESVQCGDFHKLFAAR
jgi:hypothetical protein